MLIWKFGEQVTDFNTFLARDKVYEHMTNATTGSDKMGKGSRFGTGHYYERGPLVEAKGDPFDDEY